MSLTDRKNKERGRGPKTEKEREKRHVVGADGRAGLPGQSVNGNRCVADCVVGLCDAYVACLLAGCFGSMEHIWY